MTVSALGGYDNSAFFAVSGFDSAPDNSGIYVFTNGGAGKKTVLAGEYNFSGKRIMIFNASGRLVEAGGDIFANSDVVWGSPQLSISIPAGGFAVVFNPDASAELNACCNTAMEGAMLYNATMAVAYEVQASYDRVERRLSIGYNNAKAPSKTAKRFLFVGNSATYFNGTPIQFKALANAAGKEIAVDYCTYGSAFLSQYADEANERGIAFRDKLKNGNYDYVVLQDADGAAYADSKAQLDILLPLIEDAGAEALLYMRYGFADTAKGRIAAAWKHHSTYTKLAIDFGLVCAPAADSFAVCADRYPSINLYADDGSHHSAAGAYLIACVWLEKFLGIDPSGNSYTATLARESAAALQECARLACADGIFTPTA